MKKIIEITLGELAERLEASLQGDASTLINGLSTIDGAGAGQLTFLANPHYRRYLDGCKAAAVLLREEDLEHCHTAALVVKDPYLAYAKLSHLFETRPDAVKGIHPTAVVASSAQVAASASVGAYAVIDDYAVIGENTIIGPQCVVGARSRIGDDGRLAARVTLYHDVTVGNRVVIQSGAVIGGEGFGFAKGSSGWLKIAQIGGVTIGDDVEIGANTTVDRGAISDTVLSNNVKLDNQIMIAHNVHVGEGTAMAGCVGISGSTRIGRNCMIAGGVGMVGHIEVCDNVFVTGMTMVTRSITEPGAYSSGTAMQPAAEWKKSAARLRQLDDMAKRLKALEKQLESVVRENQAALDN